MVEFNFQTPVTLRNRNQLKQFLQVLAAAEGFQLDSLSIVFCTDHYLLRLNKEYLHHNEFTDIITFDYSKDKNVVQGELYISSDRVKENAGSLGVSFSSELHRVIFHGLLHLCGYSDKSPTQRKVMRSREDHYLKEYSERST